MQADCYRKRFQHNRTSCLLREFALLNALWGWIVNDFYIVLLILCQRVIAECSAVFDVHYAVVIESIGSLCNCLKKDLEVGRLLQFSFALAFIWRRYFIFCWWDSDTCVSREYLELAKNVLYLQISRIMDLRQYGKHYHSLESWQVFWW